jgi:hypothetical protein
LTGLQAINAGRKNRATGFSAGTERLDEIGWKSAGNRRHGAQERGRRQPTWFLKRPGNLIETPRSLVEQAKIGRGADPPRSAIARPQGKTPAMVSRPSLQRATRGNRGDCRLLQKTSAKLPGPTRLRRRPSLSSRHRGAPLSDAVKIDVEFRQGWHGAQPDSLLIGLRELEANFPGVWRSPTCGTGCCRETERERNNVTSIESSKDSTAAP